MSNKLKIIIAIVVFLGALVYMVFALENLGVFSFEALLKKKYDLSFYVGEHGTAVKPEGNTVCVSVFVDISDGSWHDEEADVQKKDMHLEYLGMATEWISARAEDYGKNADFIYDWKQHPELYHEVTMPYAFYNDTLRVNTGYNLLWDYINNEIPSALLLEQYDADNIIYMTYYDVAEYNSMPAFAKDCYFDPEFSYEACYIPMAYSGTVIAPTVVAHEILHLFGAPDLYKSGSDPEFFNVSSDYVNYAAEQYPKDIMVYTLDLSTGEALLGEIKSTLSDVTAYYIGWLDEAPQDVAEFGLDLSQHDPLRPKYVPPEKR